MAEKTDFRTMYDREYIGAFDLPEGKGDLTLTIAKCTGGELTAMGGRKSKKPIVHFKETSVKPLICNKTNGKTIAAMYGNHVEGWAGKRVTLYRGSTRNPEDGGNVDCIRIRPAAPAAFATDAEEPKITAAQAQELRELLTAKGVTEAELLTFGELDKLEALWAKNFNGAKKWIDSEAKRKAQSLTS